MIKNYSKAEIIEFLTNYPEQAKFDWKKDINISNDHKKSELVKDVIAIANAHGTSDGIIIYGVDPKSDDPIIGINVTLDDATIQQIVNSKINKPIDFLYLEQDIDGHQIGIIKIIKNQKRPFIVKRNYGILKHGTIPIRKGSSTDFAFDEDLEKMYRDHKRTDYIHTQASALQKMIYEDTPISSIVGEYLELMKAHEDKEEIEWATGELTGIDRSLMVEKFGYRRLNGFLSIVDIDDPGFFTLEQIRTENPDYFWEFKLYIHLPILELEQYIPKEKNTNIFIKMSVPTKSFLEQGYELELLKKYDTLFYYLLPIEIEKVFISIKHNILNRLITL